ncbi:hypothetical protein EVAR_100199_1 [Eumeta japonica]|uniref:Uncharacterized protein n=1 Tax=Eumeta variegata TaxID=151549 RepID=A0A4C1T2A9_EUMVA|nr:hypothetical protein EVAR_100199_1 [Eumeta japonica]
MLIRELAAAKTGVGTGGLTCPRTHGEVTMTLNKGYPTNSPVLSIEPMEGDNRRTTASLIIGTYLVATTGRRNAGRVSRLRLRILSLSRTRKDQTLSPLRRPLLTRRIVRTNSDRTPDDFMHQSLALKGLKKPSEPHVLTDPDSHLTIAEDPKYDASLANKNIVGGGFNSCGVPKQQKIKRLRSPRGTLPRRTAAARAN